MEQVSIMPNPLPPGFFPLEEICANCHSYGHKPRVPEDNHLGTAFCAFFGKHFQWQLYEPDPFGNVHTPAGSRTCDHWTQKGTV